MVAVRKCCRARRVGGLIVKLEFHIPTNIGIRIRYIHKQVVVLCVPVFNYGILLSLVSLRSVNSSICESFIKREHYRRKISSIRDVKDIQLFRLLYFKFCPLGWNRCGRRFRKRKNRSSVRILLGRYCRNRNGRGQLARHGNGLARLKVNVVAFFLAVGNGSRAAHAKGSVIHIDGSALAVCGVGAYCSA